MYSQEDVEGILDGLRGCVVTNLRQEVSWGILHSFLLFVGRMHARSTDLFEHDHLEMGLSVDIRGRGWTAKNAAMNAPIYSSTDTSTNTSTSWVTPSWGALLLQNTMVQRWFTHRTRGRA